MNRAKGKGTRRRLAVRRDSGMVFVTGTDTGVGKTLLTSLLLIHCRDFGYNTLACKPFCSGDREDLDRLNAAQQGRLPLEFLNVFFSSEPVAPLVAARNMGKSVSTETVLTAIRGAKKYADELFIEGAGGILAPLGEDYGALDLIRELDCPVILVARNRLGVINQVLMAMSSIQEIGIQRVTIVLMGCEHPDISVKTNAQIIRERLGSSDVVEVNFLGNGVGEIGVLKKCAKKIKKTLARILGCVKTSHVNRTPDRGVKEIGQRNKK